MSRLPVRNEAAANARACRNMDTHHPRQRERRSLMAVLDSPPGAVAVAEYRTRLRALRRWGGSRRQNAAMRSIASKARQQGMPGAATEPLGGAGGSIDGHGRAGGGESGACSGPDSGEIAD